MSIPGLGLPSLISNGNGNAPKTIVNQEEIEAPESLDQATISTANEREDPSPETKTEVIASQKDEQKKKSEKVCVVCEKEEGRYKCPRCNLPYCSIPCLKSHKINHPPDPPKSPTTPSPVPKQNTQPAQPGTLSYASTPSPFALLANSPALRSLFTQFPDLPLHLQRIEEATHPPSPGSSYYPPSFTNGGGNRGGANSGGKGQMWNQDKGWQAGIEALKGARKVYGKDGEGVREFGRIVLRLLEDGEGGAGAYVEKEVEDENTKLIRLLLEQETANNYR